MVVLKNRNILFVHGTDTVLRPCQSPRRSIRADREAGDPFRTRSGPLIPIITTTISSN